MNLNANYAFRFIFSVFPKVCANLRATGDGRPYKKGNRRAARD